MEDVRNLVVLCEAIAVVAFWSSLIALVVIEGAITLLDVLSAR